MASLNKFIMSEKNGLNIKKKVGNIDVTMKYLPWQFLATRYKAKESQKDTIVERFKSNCFFLLSFSKDNKELLHQLDFNKYSELVSILSFKMQEKISAKTGNNIIEAADCSFQQTFGLSGANELLIVFDAEKVKNVNRLEVVVDEFGLNLGTLVFDFNVINIKSLYAVDFRKL